MSMYKRIISVICLSLIMISCFSFNAAALVFSEGDFGYEMNPITKEMSLVEYNGSAANVTIPSSYGKYPVSRITKRALSGNSTVQIVNFPLTMRNIDEKALSYCNALITINFPSYITNIGDEVCLNCSSLISVIVSAQIEKLPDYSFTGCSSLTDVSLSESITAIGSYAFQNCVSLENADFAVKVSSIGKFAFDGSGITSFAIPEGVTEIPEYCFSNCADLEFVTIHNDVEFIDSTAFVNDPKICLGVWYNSYAYYYAIDNSIPYVLMDGVKLGDTDGDGSVLINDVTEIQLHLAELESLDGIYLYAADANRDGFVDISDATAIQMFLAEYEIPYPIGEMITQ